MPASSDGLKVARSWIGTSETDVTFHERYDRLGQGELAHVKLSLAIEESLRSQLAALVLDQPAQLSTGGDSFNWTANIKAMQEQLSSFLSQGGIPDPDSAHGVGIAQLVRKDLR